MKRREWTVNLVMLLIGAVFIFESVRLGLGRIQRPGPGMLPMITSSGLSLVALFSLVRSLLAPQGGPDAQGFFGQRIGNVITIIIGLVGYVLLLPWLGYLTATCLLLMFLFRAAGLRNWGKVGLYSLVSTGLTYLVFSYWLGLRFPTGIMGF